MSRTKFNGFEKYFITTALKHAIEEAENDIKEIGRRRSKDRSMLKVILRMIGNELIAKVNDMTLKKHQ